MPEALTESFCERCGTRYEFPAPAKLSTLRKTRGLVSGFKNYIMSQDALSDTIEDAMRSEEEVLAAHQLEAFHAAFNFCINCRQYACTNCWNESAGRCRTCVPIPGVDDLDDRMEAAYLADHRAMHADAVAETIEADEIARRLDVDAWPESDLPEVAATNGHEPMEWPDDSLTPAASADVEPEPVGYAPAAELEPEPVAAEAETPAEIEPQPVAAEAEPELHPILSWEEDAEITFVPSIEEELPEPQAVWVTAEAGAAEPAAIDEDALAARRAQLDVLGIEDPGMGQVGPAHNVLPYRSSGAAVGPSELVQRTLGGSPALWDASAREVASARSAIAVQNCGSCGLSLSASARFCRRCGQRQAQSA